MINYNVDTLSKTELLGQKIGSAISEYFSNNKQLPVQSLLLRGPLGSGKTSLTRHIVQSLPRGRLAEISSPSFTLCNNYATLPEVLHVDLYRCEHNIPHDLWEAIDMQDILSIIEWAEFLPADALAQNFLDIFFKMCNNKRSVEISAHGPQAQCFLQSLQLA